ncbi:MAG TPA: hypothetical protein VFY15_04485 [Acidimicrobiia bacterium]|nr:hypothetical protein [Acidimicrobiia bacterium]
MDQASRDLLVAFSSGFAPYLQERLAERGWPSIPEAVQQGSECLGRSLGELLAQPYARQMRTPLELFQEALAPANEALEAAGVPVPVRDNAATSALPGDRYDLAPASSAALGEEAWRAHLVWGAAKAAAVTRPAVALLASNLLDRDRIERVVVARGLRLDPIRGAAAVGGQVLVLVDLTDPAADETITAAAAAGVRTIGFGPHVDEFAMVRARSLGATLAMARSQFFRDLEGLLPDLV